MILHLKRSDAEGAHASAMPEHIPMAKKAKKAKKAAPKKAKKKK